MDVIASANATERTPLARVAGMALIASGLLGIAMVATLAANGLLGAFHFGYPVWALRLGRRLLAGPTEG